MRYVPWVLALVVGCVGAAVAEPGTETDLRVAVLPFSAEPPAYRQLAEAATAVLQERFGQVDGIEVVDRERLSAALNELSLATLAGDGALRLGELVGANHVVFGAAVVQGGKVTLTARLVDLSSSAVVAASAAAGKVSQGLTLTDRLATELAAKRNLTLAAVRVPDRIEKVPDYGMAWLLGLSAYYAGQHAQAVGYLLRAKRLDPKNPTVRLSLTRAYLALQEVEQARVEVAELKQQFAAAKETREAEALLP